MFIIIYRYCWNSISCKEIYFTCYELYQEAFCVYYIFHYQQMQLLIHGRMQVLPLEELY